MKVMQTWNVLCTGSQFKVLLLRLSFLGVPSDRKGRYRRCGWSKSIFLGGLWRYKCSIPHKLPGQTLRQLRLTSRLIVHLPLQESYPYDDCGFNKTVMGGWREVYLHLASVYISSQHWAPHGYLPGSCSFTTSCSFHIGFCVSTFLGEGETLCLSNGILKNIYLFQFRNFHSNVMKRLQAVLILQTPIHFI